jgi:hypothetical protein
MAVTAAMEDSLLDSELTLEEAMEAMEATAMDSGVPAVALAVIREVGRSNACHGRICSQKNRDLFATMDEDSKLRKRERRKERKKKRRKEEKKKRT